MQSILSTQPVRHPSILSLENSWNRDFTMTSGRLEYILIKDLQNLHFQLTRYHTGSEMTWFSNNPPSITACGFCIVDNIMMHLLQLYYFFDS